MSAYVISAHAVDRYRSRVEPIDRDSARDAVKGLLDEARIRPTPRHWMRSGTAYGSGVRFGYSARAPHVAFVLRGSTVVTVLTRAMYRRALAPTTLLGAHEADIDTDQPRSEPY